MHPYSNHKMVKITTQTLKKALERW